MYEYEEDLRGLTIFYQFAAKDLMNMPNNDYLYLHSDLSGSGDHREYI